MESVELELTVFLGFVGEFMKLWPDMDTPCTFLEQFGLFYLQHHKPQRIGCGIEGDAEVRHRMTRPNDVDVRIFTTTHNISAGVNFPNVYQRNPDWPMLHGY